MITPFAIIVGTALLFTAISIVCAVALVRRRPRRREPYRFPGDDVAPWADPYTFPFGEIAPLPAGSIIELHDHTHSNTPAKTTRTI